MWKEDKYNVLHHKPLINEPSKTQKVNQAKDKNDNRVENGRIELPTSCMLSTRSTNWANPPICKWSRSANHNHTKTCLHHHLLSLQNLTPSPKGVKEPITLHRNSQQNFRASQSEECTSYRWIQRYFAAQLPLIKSKTEQRNHHWHLVNVSLYHLFTTYINHGEKATKGRRNHPLKVSLCNGMFRKCAGREHWCVAAAIDFKLTLFYTVFYLLTTSICFCLSLLNNSGRTKRKSTNLLHRSLTTKAAETRRKLRR